MNCDGVRKLTESVLRSMALPLNGINALVALRLNVAPSATLGAVQVALAELVDVGKARRQRDGWYRRNERRYYRIELYGDYVDESSFITIDRCNVEGAILFSCSDNDDYDAIYQLSQMFNNHPERLAMLSARPDGMVLYYDSFDVDHPGE